MKTIKIKHNINNKVLFEGKFINLKQCVEAATHDNANLEYANLRHVNLQGANIDSLKLSYADLSGANLNNANISEAALRFINFQGASLIGTCLAESDLTNSNFENAAFGGTEIAGAILDNCLFSTLSAMQLSFQDTTSMKSCTFKTVHGHIIPLSQPPIVITGALNAPITIMDQNILIGHRILPINILQSDNAQKFIQSKIAKIGCF